jgi:hypothetical protein
MYDDSGPFLRESALPSGFAGRRMERRLEPGAAARGVWRSPGGAVLRLPPERLATLAAEVRAAAHPAHPAAADPQTAVREHVAALAHAARPAGTVAHPASGRTLHVFRAPGRAGEMEIVTAPPRGVLFDIMEVRPAAVLGELEIYHANAAAASDAAGRRHRGPRVTITWTTQGLSDFVQNPINFPHTVYVLALVDGNFMEPNGVILLHRPRYVGQTAELAARWQGQENLLRALGGNPQAPFAIWIGSVGPAPQNLDFHGAAGLIGQQGVQEDLMRRDVEHVLIRSINRRIEAFNNRTLFNNNVNNGNVQQIIGHNVTLTGLTNRSSAQQVVASPGAGNDPGGIDITNNMDQGVAHPWFLEPQIQVAAGTVY